MGLDIVIRNGLIIDGSGGPARRGDVGVSDGVIVAVGDVDERGSHELDADGRVVTPGFVDGHTHMDAQVMWDQMGTSSCWHGVTTVVMGNCGFTLAPARSNERELVVRSLERAEDISADALGAGVTWSWETFAEYLDAVDAQPKAINYAANIGHSALRTFVMGEAAFEGPANEDQVIAMEDELRSALRAGAVGFTTSLSDAHRTSDDRPVASRLCSWDELSRLVGVLGSERAGVFELAQPTEVRSPDPAIRAATHRKMRDLAVRTRVPTTFGVSATQPYAGETLQLIDDTVDAGGRMFGLAHCRGINSVQSFKTKLAFDNLAGWADFRQRSLDEQLAMLKDPQVRDQLKQAVERGEYGESVGVEARPANFDEYFLFDSTVDANRSVASVAAERGCDPIDVVLDSAVASDLAQLYMAPISRQTQDELLAVMRHPRTIMTFSDSGAHVSQISDASLHTYFLAHWVRQRQEFGLEQAVRMVTWEVASAWGIPRRGLLRPGWVADLNVFDPAQIEPMLPTVERDLPGGAVRLEQKARGIDYTIVGGQVIVDHCQPTGDLPGRLVRGPLATRS